MHCVLRLHEAALSNIEDIHRDRRHTDQFVILSAKNAWRLETGSALETSTVLTSCIRNSSERCTLAETSTPIFGDVYETPNSQPDARLDSRPGAAGLDAPVLKSPHTNALAC